MYQGGLTSTRARAQRATCGLHGGRRCRFEMHTAPGQTDAEQMLRQSQSSWCFAACAHAAQRHNLLKECITMTFSVHACGSGGGMPPWSNADNTRFTDGGSSHQGDRLGSCPEWPDMI